jgi:Holliday junction resolvasome RuvABC endonuclease subunit
MNKQFRILAISLSSRGFGYAVLQGDDWLIDYGKKVINKDKNVRVLGHIEKIITRKQPDVLVLQDVNARGARRDPRIKRLHTKIIMLAKKRKLKVMKFSGIELRRLLLGDATGTKHEMAELMAKQFPDELASRLPPKRKPWKSQDARMDIFDAVALGIAFRLKK